MFGVEWNAVCVFIEHCDASKAGKVASNSSTWGNYACGDSTFKLDRGFYNIYNSNFTGWKAKDDTQKKTSEKWLYTTGAVDRNRSLNIYDFAGNLWEWTLEMYSLADGLGTARGSDFSDTTTLNAFASNRVNFDTSYSNYHYSSRPHFFIK